MVSIAAICAGPEGILHPGVETTVDGTIALDGMHVFGGQILRTGNGRYSELLTRGSALRLLGDTKLQFKGDSADLLAGGLLLSTSTRFPTQSGCVQVTPDLMTASRYLVQVQKKTVYVSAEQNQITVTARRSVRVPAGKTVAVYCGSAAQSIVFVGKDLAPKIIMGTSAASAPFAALPASGGAKPDMSPPSPSHQ
jgi:hypothetical protein